MPCIYQKVFFISRRGALRLAQDYAEIALRFRHRREVFSAFFAALREIYFFHSFNLSGINKSRRCAPEA